MQQALAPQRAQHAPGATCAARRPARIAVHHAHQAGAHSTVVYSFRSVALGASKANTPRAQVIINGFKSYKDQIAVDEFSPKLNTVGTLALAASCPQP